MQLADRTVAEKVGVQGLLASVRPAEGVAKGGPVKVSVDVSHIAGSFGGDWLSRARLVTLPECALTTPERAECRTQTPLATAKDGDRPGLLSAEVPLAAGSGLRLSSASGAASGATVFAAAAAPGGSAGTYAATSLAPSGSWSSGSSTGGFSWSYPIAVPEGLGGTKPGISLSYSSQAIDGRTAATNNQSSWIGEGWDYSPGFIERRFKPCAKDGQTGSGEQCLAGENATFSLGGKSSALVKDDTSGTWRLEGDDASKVERLTGAANGDNNGEHWKVTAPDGTQYYFGVGRKPGSSTAPATNSAWTTPVYGNNAGEECNQSTFDASWCQQAWRWNLDFVVDPRGGMTTHWYDTETNHYKRGVSAANPAGTITPYIRGGNLTKITYGSKVSDADTVKPTAQVLFATEERCLPDAGFDCAPAKLTKANAAKWPDVPFDQNCTATGTCENTSATFWSTKRLTTITTQVLSGTGSYENVDSYALKHQFPDPQDGTAPALWLASLTHTGYDGATKLDTPPVVFYGKLLNNRVDSSGDNRPALNRHRIVQIKSETGKTTDVGYADAECTPGGGLPSSQDSNTKRCYPVYWNPDFKSPLDPTLDWFHKYVVTRVTEMDPFGGSPLREVRYEYVGAAAWHRDDEELTEDKFRSWNQFRGYEQVITRAGTAPDVVSKTANFYLRGMDGDVKADGSKRAVTFTGLAGNTIPDSSPLAGSLRESQTFTADGGEVVSISQSEPWLSAATATHSRGAKLPALTAQMQRGGSSRNRALLADKTWRETSQTAKYDAYGMPESVQDHADGLPDTCTTTSYVRNTAAWMLDRVSETVQTQAACGIAATEANTLVRNRVYFDNQPFGTLTGPGQATSTEGLDRFESGQPKYTAAASVTYDAYGRTTSITDAGGAKTTTAFEPAAPARATTLKVTNAKNWTTTSTLHALRGLPVKTVDQNNRTTEITYDALGRTTAVWQPGRTRDQNASSVFSYDLTQTGTTSVTSQVLRSDESYATSIGIFDAMGQQIQVQSDTQNGWPGARLITDTTYDTRGRASTTTNTYINKDSDPVKTRFIADKTTVPGQNTTLYDGMGRPVTGIFSSEAQEQWRSTTAYPGADRVDTIPPKGSTATSSITDARGRKVEQRQYKTGTPTGDFDSTRYAYNATGKLERITDPAGNTWTYDYDLHGRQIKAVDPDKGTSSTTYDAADRPVSSVDARGTSIFTSYDILGRPTSRNLNAVDGPKLATYDYDTLLSGLPTASTRWVDGKAWRQEITGYDIGYRTTGTKLTVPAGEGALTGTYATSTSYEPITGTEDITEVPAAGGLPRERLYTSRNINSLPVGYGSDNVDYVNFTDYDELGQVQRTTFGDMPKQVSVTNIQDPATGRLLSTELKKQDSNTAVDITDYTYTPAGDVTSVTSTQGAVRDAQCFTYDYQHRLIEAWTDTGTTTTQPGPSVPGIGGCTTTLPQPSTVGGPAPYWQSFTYDVTGNRKTLTDHDPTGDASKTSVTTNTYPAPGSPRPHTPTSTKKQTGSGPAISKDLTYDNTGNTLTRPDAGGATQTLTWTPEGNLASATTGSGTSSYLYDASGNRLLRRDPGKTTLYVGSDELTLDTAANKVTGTRYYATPGGTTIVRTSDGKLSYVAADHHNTGNTAIDAATLQTQRRVTKPFGEDRGATPSSWPGERGFVGGTQDKTTGLTHLGAREYDPYAGRFLSVDPLMVVDDTRQHNAYQYGNNSPLTASDPSGLRSEECGTLYNCGSKGTMTLTNTEDISYRDDDGSWLAGTQHLEGNRGKSQSGANHSGPPTVTSPDGNVYVLPAVNLGEFTELYRTAYLKQVAFWGEQNDPKYDWDMRIKALLSACSQMMDRGCDPAQFIYANAKSTVENYGVFEGGGMNRPALGSSARAGAAGGNCGKCFLAGTDVLMADGTTKDIEDIQLGDRVWAADPETGESGEREVTRLIATEDDKHFNALSIATDGGIEELTATYEHPFWSPSVNAWVEARDLAPGSTLLTNQGKVVIVTANKPYSGHARTYNLTVDDLHTYYVLAGETPVLVHNASCPTFTTGKPISGPLPDAGQTSLYALVKPSSGELLKWGISKNPVGRYKNSDYEGGARMVILRNYDSRQDALDVERYMTERHPGPLNFEPHRGSVAPTQSWEKDLQHVTGGGFFRDRDGW
ncbi:polymorphic toxin-type HINT domain-containing protein [Streptomyces sp. NPDC051183]|uniref:polymorphic toxin-type HINT domain-containing protein n=1 Tax=Streptomyces sp. NPDC051183 TaxID=3155165 RepID=UPI003430E60C